MTMIKTHIIEEKNKKTNESLNHPGVKAKPFLKWAGGKGQLIGIFQEIYPVQLKQEKIKYYYEPFLGSGAVFFDIIQKYAIENAYLYDINEELVLIYRVIQQDVSKLLDILHNYQKIYSGLNLDKKKIFYYEQRNNYNSNRFNLDYETYTEQWIPRAAQFIFLNRTCYNGLYRVNSKGEFNTPVGDYKNPTICDEQNLCAVHKVLQIAEIKKGGYKAIINDLKDNSFVYFDPPYRPISKTASFNAYSKHNFTDEHQVELAKIFWQLDQKGAQIMLSNSDPKNINPDDHFFDDIYNGYNIRRVPAKRRINSDASKRGTINEIVVTNYPTIFSTR